MENDMLHVYSQDGCMVKAPTWHAWRKYATLHMRRPCRSCEGSGEQSWFIEASGYTASRWFSVACTTCEGKGWQMP